MKRHLYTSDHEDFRKVVREFVDRELVGNLERWEEDRLVPREVWRAAGEQGVIGLSAPEELGGAGVLRDYRFRNVLIEEFSKVFATSVAAGFSLQDDITIPYITELGNEEQKQRWLPRMVTGEIIGAIAMTEPGTGSDLRGITTSGRKVDGGWVVNGSKTFITNGIQSDIVITVVRTSSEGGSNAFSLLVVEKDMEGFSRGRKLKKVGLHGQDTAELVYEDVFVPEENLLGSLGGGLNQLRSLLPLERLSIAASSIASATAVFESTVEYTNERKAFGQPIADFQNSRFELADMATQLDVTRAFVDQAILAYNDGDLSVVDAAKAKLWASEVQNRVIDRCLQLHGGYGYMLEYPVGRAFQDARINRIFGGANEIMKEIIGRDVVGRR